MSRHWIVICPVERMQAGSSRVREPLWDRWYRENCVAVGFPPPPERDNVLYGPAPTRGWTDKGWGYARNRLKEIQVGDAVIPFLKERRIGPVGIINKISVSDEEWNPTIQPDELVQRVDRHGNLNSRLGRRIGVEWQVSGMPPNGRYATVPKSHRSNRPLARHTIEKISNQRFSELCAVLADPSNWSDVCPPDFSSLLVCLAS
jgi:hypothetical protein